MKLRSRFISSTFLLTIWLARGQDTFVYDQQSTNLIEGTAFLNYLWQPMGQSFTPSLSAVGFVTLNLYDAGSSPIGATVYVNIRSNSLTGPILGSSVLVSMPDQFFGITNFSFTTPVSVVPGLTYYLEPVAQPGSDGWGSYVTDGSYAGGTIFASGGPVADRDLWFREGIVVPEPSALWMSLFGAGTLVGWRCSMTKRGRLSLKPSRISALHPLSLV
jgi:hypothetical protein